MTLSYFNIQKFCIHDGPGIRTTVFLKGCPLRCTWCHNPESQKTKPELLFWANKCTACGRCIGLCDARSISTEGKLVLNRRNCTACGKCVEKCFHFANALRGQTGSVEEILQEVVKDKPFYDTSGGGLTISGGEPSAQPEAVLALIEQAKDREIGSAIETCGFGPADFYRRCAELGVLFLFDIKGIDPEKHRKNTGVDPKRIHENLELLLGMNARIILRMPLIPGYNDTDEDLRLLADFLRERAGGILYAEIMPYHNLGNEKRRNLGLEADDTIPDGKGFTGRWLDMLRESGVDIRVSGA